MALRLRRQPMAQANPAVGTTDDEDEIVVRALVDCRAFAPLYERYVDAIYRHCYRSLGEREAAEDVTALVFRKVLERLHTFRGGSFKAWIFTIADNALRDAARAARPSLPFDEAGDFPDPVAGPEELAFAAIDRDQLRLALGTLPDEWRRVVTLRLDGFACAEVAQILGNGRTTEWVRQTHHRAMLRLRDYLLTPATQRGGAR